MPDAPAAISRNILLSIIASRAIMPTMRPVLSTLLILLFAANSGRAQLFADFSTTAGDFTCELNYADTPRTVGNFVSLAEGTRNWVDESTGIMSTVSPPQPFYTGVSFHRVVNTEGFKIIQAGSKTGNGTDGPGYEIPDEMNSQLPATFRFNQPYSLAMANVGPNTNGSQFFITGGAIPGLEGKHTVFGKVTSGQAVIDAILHASVDDDDQPLEDITINSVFIRRVGESAGKFKAGTQRLPTMSIPDYDVEPAPAPATDTNRYFFSQGQRSEFLPYAALESDLHNWQKLPPRWHAPSPVSVRYYDVTYPAGNPVSGLRPVLVKYDVDAITPVSPAGWSLSMENADGSYLFSFPVQGVPGYMFTPHKSNTSQTGFINNIDYAMSPYHALIRLELDKQKILDLHLGFDKKIQNNLLGRCVSKTAEFIFENAETGPGHYSDLVETGGDKGFTMVPIN